MSYYTTNSQERIARERYHDATFVGVDGDDAAHYWSRYHQAVVVLDDETVTYEVSVPAEADDGTLVTNLREWIEYVRTRRGWDHHRVGSSVIKDLRRVVQ